MKKWLVLLMFLLMLPTWGQSPDKNQAIHDELRAMKDRCVESLNAGDLDAVMQLADDEIVFTAMDARLAHGKDELRAYFDKMLKGPDRIVEGLKTSVTADSLTTLYGSDFGVATGTSKTDYDLAHGADFQIENRWTATLVRKDGRWLIASFHSSANVFENPILDLAKGSAKVVGGVAAIVFLLLGLGIGRATKKA